LVRLIPKKPRSFERGFFSRSAKQGEQRAGHAEVPRFSPAINSRYGSPPSIGV
jgi:hypothetical protein